MLTFSPITLSNTSTYYAYWDKTPCHSIDYTLPNLFGWRDYFALSIAESPNLYWIHQEKPTPCFWAPLGAWEDVDWEAELALLPKPLTMIRVPAPLLTVLEQRVPAKLTVEEARGQWEYLYRRNDLIDLSGKAFHKKKTHCSNFIRTYGEPDYRPINDAIVEDVLALEDEWCQWHECDASPSLRAENAAINQVLSHWGSFRNLLGGALYVNDKICAFSLGERLDATSIGVHYEKGLLGYKGIYQTINREFVRHTDAHILSINRAQDLDEEGLRQAKLSYNPSDFIKKYTVHCS
ncbi:MAG: DUF2156 domain-containing protein [Desulfovibrio sp.]|nr:DUF2156 domain-containing protein [Desulfovibrio sp.]